MSRRSREDVEIGGRVGKLLTGPQRKYLGERIDAKSQKLKRHAWTERDRGQHKDTPAVKKAREQIAKLQKMIREHDKQHDQEVEAFNRKIAARATKVRESLIFDTAETALMEVEDFEGLTREDFGLVKVEKPRKTGKSTKGKP